jgi:hypothetical protein
MDQTATSPTGDVADDMEDDDDVSANVADDMDTEMAADADVNSSRPIFEIGP